jgi:hypothetical protein
LAVSPSPDQTITGRVTSVNPKGVKLDGHDGWLNFSRYANDIVPPMRGQTVTLTLHRQGFVRSVHAVGVTAKTDEIPDVGRRYGTPPLSKLTKLPASGTAPSPGWPS